MLDCTSEVDRRLSQRAHLTPDEIVGRSTPRVLSGGVTSREEYQSFWKELLSREVVGREFVNRTKQGSRVEIESSANPILLNGELVGFLAVLARTDRTTPWTYWTYVT